MALGIKNRRHGSMSHYYLAVMAAEAEAHQDHDGLSGDEAVIRM